MYSISMPGPVPGTNVAYFGPEIRIGVPQPALNVDMDAETNVEIPQLHLRRAWRAAVDAHHPRSDYAKIPIPIPIPDVSLLRPPLAIRPALAMRSDVSSEMSRTWIRFVPRARRCQIGEARSITGSGSLDVCATDGR